MDGDCLDCRGRKAGDQERMQQQGGGSAEVLIAGPSPDELPGELLLGKVRLVEMLDVQPGRDRLVGRITGPETAVRDVELENGTAVVEVNLGTGSAKWGVKPGLGTATLDVKPEAETTGNEL